MKHDIWTYIYLLVAIPFVSRLFGFTSSGNPSYLVTGSMGILVILLIFRNYKIFNTILPMALMSLVIFSGLILSYIYILEPIYVSSNEFIYAIGTLLLYVIFFLLTIYQRGKNHPT